MIYPKPMYRWSIYPQQGKPYRFEICLFSSLPRMYDYAAHVWKIPEKTFAALCVSYGALEQSKHGRKMGEILFTRKGVSMETLCHEACHAAHHWYSHFFGQQVIVIAQSGKGHPSEETVAEAQGALVKQLVEGLAARGISVESHS